MTLDPIQPPRGRHWLRWTALGQAVLAGAVISYGAVRIWFPASRDATMADVTILPGQSATAISAQLERAGLIRERWLFLGYAHLTGQGNRLQVGAYRLPRNLTLPQLLKKLTTAARRDEKTLTVVEGWSNRELAEYLASQGVAAPADLLGIVQRKAPWWDAYDFLASRPAKRDLEGYLFPDTYRMFADATVLSLVQKMLDNFGRKLTPEIRQEIQRQGKTLHAVLTLASIVEREVPAGPDRQKIAGIFLRRLSLGMPLQADATVNYVTGKKTPRPSLDDVKTNSLYNTYIYRGLPPGPINNPGLSAIRAVLYPEPSPYLFYLTTLEGAVIYSRTHDEHVAAKAQFYP